MSRVMATIAMASFAMFIPSTSNAIDYDSDARSPVDQMKVDQFCCTGNYAYIGGQPEAAQFILCEILMRLNQQSERIKYLEQQIQYISNGR